MKIRGSETNTLNIAVMVNQPVIRSFVHFGGSFDVEGTTAQCVVVPLRGHTECLVDA